METKNWYKFTSKFVKKYLVQIITIFLLANSTVALLIFSKAQNASCMTQSDINSDSRCLYIYHNDVYEKGTKNNPHQGIGCGTNVDSSIPSLHFSGSIFTRFGEAKIAAFCTGPQPTTPPTTAPTEAPTTAPTQAPTTAPTDAPSGETTAPTATTASVATTVATSKPQATKTAEPTKPSATTVTSSTTTPTQTPSPTSNTQTINNSGSSFGEILGRPSGIKETKKPIVTNKAEVKKEFKLTNISKPVTYASVLSVIGSIILILIF